MTTTFGDLAFGGQKDPYMLIGIAVVAATVGMFSHWVKLRYKDKENTNLLEYFFVDNLKATLIAFASMLGGLAATFGPLDYTTISVYQVLTQAFTLGYASDSLLNNTSDQSSN